jgi:hypothetical protein
MPLVSAARKLGARIPPPLPNLAQTLSSSCITLDKLNIWSGTDILRYLQLLYH